MEQQVLPDILQDEDIMIRASAIIELGKIGKREAVRPLTTILENK
jgi:HEAT repeat protein